VLCLVLFHAYSGSCFGRLVVLICCGLALDRARDAAAIHCTASVLFGSPILERGGIIVQAFPGGSRETWSARTR